MVGDGGLRPGAVRRGVHVRRHGHAALRRENRAGKSRAGNALKGVARRRALRLRAKPLRVPARRLAGDRPEEREVRRSVDNSIQHGRLLRSGARRAIERGSGSPPSSPRWDDRRLRDRRPGGDRRVRERLVREYQLDYTPHIHADAVIGWAWCVFNDYDFAANPLGFRGRTVRRWRGASTASGISSWPTPSASTSTRRASRRISRRSSCSRTADDCCSPATRDDALSVPVGRAPPRHVHAGNQPQRLRADGGAGQPAAVRQGGLQTLLGHAVENGGDAPRAHRSARRH